MFHLWFLIFELPFMFLQFRICKCWPSLLPKVSLLMSIVYSWFIHSYLHLRDKPGDDGDVSLMCGDPGDQASDVSAPHLSQSRPVCLLLPARRHLRGRAHFIYLGILWQYHIVQWVIISLMAICLFICDPVRALSFVKCICCENKKEASLWYN